MPPAVLVLLRNLKESGPVVGGIEGAGLRGEVHSWHKMRTPLKNIKLRAAASLLLLWRHKARQEVDSKDGLQQNTSLTGHPASGAF